MSIRLYKSYTPGTRGRALSSFTEITKNKPEKKLINKNHRNKGRNNQGIITIRHRGGGHKRKYRIIDFCRNKYNIEGTVSAIEYDPNRNARLALICYKDGEKRYILAPDGLEVGRTVHSGTKSDILIGNALAIRFIPEGTEIHNIELKPGKGGQICRAAGSFAQVLGKEETYAQVRLMSGEVRKIHLDCMATIGKVGNLQHENVHLGKAGRRRWMGVRPTVRGVAMNPVDHPHGGGEGKTSGGRHPVSPWGKPEGRTRKRKASDAQIIRRRKSGKGRK